MPFFQSIEINSQHSHILNSAWWFSNFASSIFVFPFSTCCCYFIIYIFLSGLPLIYWTKLLLLSTQVLLHEIVPIQYKVWVDSLPKIQRAIPLDLANAIQVLPTDKTIISKQNSIKKIIFINSHQKNYWNKFS